MGAYAVDDDDDVDQYNLVEWASELHEMEENENIIVENTLMTVFKEDWVCEGRWLDRVERAKYWYTVSDTIVTARMKNVLHANLIMKPITSDNPMPKLHPTIRDIVLPLNPRI
jgi:hypothetical protein